MTTLRAHFDGRVLVPDSPADLPLNRALEIQVREVESSPESRGFCLAIDERTGLPYVKVPAGTPTITPEMIRQAEEDS